MKKFLIILLLLFTSNISIAQTRPSYLQLRDTPCLDFRSFGAVADGNAETFAGTDNGPAFLLAITAAQAQKKPLYIPGGTYIFDVDVATPLVTSDISDLVIFGDGPGVTNIVFKRSTLGQYASFMRVKKVDGLHISNISWDGGSDRIATPTTGIAYMFDFWPETADGDCKNITFENCEFDRVWQAFINSKYTDALSYYTENVSITNCVFRRSSRHLVVPSCWKNSRITNCYFEYAGDMQGAWPVDSNNVGAAISITRNSKKITVSDCNMRYCTRGIRMGVHFGQGEPDGIKIVENISITNVTTTDTVSSNTGATDYTWCADGNNISISNCHIYSPSTLVNSQPALSIRGTNIRISNTVLSGAPNDTTVLLYEPAANIYMTNTSIIASGTDAVGVRISSSTTSVAFNSCNFFSESNSNALLVDSYGIAPISVYSLSFIGCRIIGDNPISAVYVSDDTTLYNSILMGNLIESKTKNLLCAGAMKKGLISHNRFYTENPGAALDIGSSDLGTDNIIFSENLVSSGSAFLTSSDTAVIGTQTLILNNLYVE